VSASFPLPHDEADRLAALDRLKIVDTPRAPEFDAILTLATRITNCRAGVIGLMEGDRHWFKAVRGLDRADAPRAISLCNYTLLQAEPLIVENLTRDPRFCNNPFVTERGTSFYAGVALADQDGCKVGTLCVTDRDPRGSDPAIAETLKYLGRVVEGLLETHARSVQAFQIAEKAAVGERELWKKTRLLEQSEQIAKIGSWEFDPESRTFVLSDEACRIHELPVGTILHIDDMHARFPLSDLDLVAARYRNAEETGEGYEILGDIITAKGNARWTHRIVETEKRNGKVVRIFSAIRDVSADRLAEQALWRAAHYDALTGAPNRHSWTVRLDEAFARASGEQRGLTILILDLDGFKEINDTRGHAAGDGVLCEIARRLESTLPNDAFHARLGGDEFAVLLEGMRAPADIEIIVRALLMSIQKPIVVDTQRLQISGTFGCASFPVDAPTAADLMQKADIALYQAKRSHRSSFVSFRPEIGDLFNDKRHAIDLVAAAIEQNHLVPFYQPKIDLKTGQLLGFEALCRIEAVDGTILGPNQFLPALRDPASSARIGRTMLNLVTSDIVAWRADGLTPGRIAINVTGDDFADGAFHSRVLGRLSSLNLPATALEIEVTENTILGKETAAVNEALQTLRDQGIVISLDDFGTGYASLTHLRDAPIQCIKLDRSFINELNQGGDTAIIVKSIVDLGHSLGMRIVAEGIETNGQAEFLRSIGCDEAQGFLFGRPAARNATRLLLQERERWNGVTQIEFNRQKNRRRWA
jgi:diguanylate cyclase (GGDEF)-like protein